MNGTINFDEEALAQAIALKIHRKLGLLLKQPEEVYYKKKEVAAYLQVDPRTIDNYIHDFQLPFIRMSSGNGGIRFRKSSIDKWMNKRETKAVGGLPARFKR